MSTESVAQANLRAEQSGPKLKGRWRNLMTLAFSMLVDGSEGSVVPALFPLIRESLNLSLGSLGILTATNRLVSVIFGPIWAVVARRYNRKNILIFVTGIWGVWTIALGFAQGYAMLLGLSIVAAVGTVASVPIVSEVLADLFPDEERGRAAGVLYGMTFGFGAILFPLLGQLGRITEGWRIGFFTMGGLSVLGGILIWLFFQDPGRGASERELAGLEAEKREAYGIVRLSEIRELLRIPTFVLMLVSRLLSGHLLLFSFGVVYMVDVFNYDTATATLLLSPLILFNTIGNVIGGLISDSINKRSPRVGRILIMQLIQFFFAILAFFGLQFDWGNSWIFAVFFAGLGFLQGLGPGINRPIIMAVTPPEMRATAFALFVSVIEAFGWAIYNLLGGFLSERFGLQPVFLVVLVGLMLANALFIFTIYRPYPRDVEKIHRLLQARHQQLTEAP